MRITKEELEAALEEIDDISDKTTYKFTDGKLKGYKVRIRTDGDHLHDGQLVEYELQFTSPKKKQKTITTLMCLMVEWNFGKDYYTL